MLISSALILIFIAQNAAYEFEVSECVQSSVPKICQVKIHKQKSKENGSVPTQIQVTINHPFRWVPIGQQDIIERQIVAAKMRQQQVNLYGMDQSTIAMVQLMSTFSDQPKSFEEAYRKHKKRQLDRFEFFRDNPSEYSNWIHGKTQTRFATNYWEDTIEQDKFLLPALQFIFYGKGKLKTVLRNEDDGSWKLIQPGGSILRMNRNSRGAKTDVDLLLPFEPKKFSLSLLDEEDRILDHLGTKQNFSHRGAYLILKNFEVLPRFEL